MKINKIIILLALFLMIIPFSLADSTLNTIKILPTPSYKSAFTNGIQSNYTLIVDAPDGIKSINQAMLNFEVYLSPTVNMRLTVNGQNCTPATYNVGTTFASAGQALISYDCTNIINKSGTYAVSMLVDKTTGSSQSWLDLTYLNNPFAEIKVHGTEYLSGQDAKVWLQLLNTTNSAINNAVCYATIYNPDHTTHVNQALMTNSQTDGIYYYDLIAPNEAGVYPVIATCYYQATSTPYYATTGQIDYGTFSSGTFSDTVIQDGNFIRFTESTANPAIRNISIQANFSNLQNCSMVSEDLMTGIDIHSYMKFDSVNGDDITIQIFNHTSGQWMSLPNLHPEGNFFASVSNTIPTNNITKAGIYNSTHGVRIRFRDTQLADGATSNLDIDHLHLACNQLASPQYQEVKGSSEMHITLAQGEYTFAVNTLCDDEDTDGSCAVFFQNTSILNEPQGLIQENITITNVNFVDIDEPLYYETGATIDCTGIRSVQEIRSNGSITDLTELTNYNVGHGLENCELKIPVTMEANETQYVIQIVMENFAQWELQRGIDFIKTINQTDTNYCHAQNSTPYLIPINQSLTGSSEQIFCNRHLDDIYWYELNYADSTQANTIGDLEGFLQVSRFYFSDMMRDANRIKLTIQGQIDQTQNNATQSMISALSNQSIQQFQSLQESINQTILNIATLQGVVQNQSFVTNQQYNNVTSQLSALQALTILQYNNVTGTLNQLQSGQLNQTQQLMQINELLSYMNATNAQTQVQLLSINQSITAQFAITNALIYSAYQNVTTQISITNGLINTGFANITSMIEQLSLQSTSQYQNLTNITQTNQNWLTQLWAYITGYMTSLQQQINQTTLENQQLLQTLINQTNTTRVPSTITYLTQNCIAGSNWIITSRVFDQYGMPLDNTSTTCNIFTSIDNSTNQMNYESPDFIHSQVCPTSSSWNFTITCI